MNARLMKNCDASKRQELIYGDSNRSSRLAICLCVAQTLVKSLLFGPLGFDLGHMTDYGPRVSF